MQALTSDESGKVYISERGPGRIYACSFQGCPFSFETQSATPLALAVSPVDGMLYVSNLGKPSVDVYNSQTGNAVMTIAIQKLSTERSCPRAVKLHARQQSASRSYAAGARPRARKNLFRALLERLRVRQDAFDSRGGPARLCGCLRAAGPHGRGLCLLRLVSENGRRLCAVGQAGASDAGPRRSRRRNAPALAPADGSRYSVSAFCLSRSVR